MVNDVPTAQMQVHAFSHDPAGHEDLGEERCVERQQEPLPCFLPDLAVDQADVGQQRRWGRAFYTFPRIKRILAGDMGSCLYGIQGVNISAPFLEDALLRQEPAEVPDPLPQREAAGVGVVEGGA